MTIFSKIHNTSSDPSMWMFGELLPPFGFVSFAGVVVLGILSYFAFKKLGNDMTVGVRDSTKSHSWTPIKITAKVCICITFLHFQTSCSVGLVLFDL